MCSVHMQVLGRALRVDHKHDYQVPKEHGDEDDLTKQLREHGCAPSLEADKARMSLLHLPCFLTLVQNKVYFWRKFANFNDLFH